MSTGLNRSTGRIRSLPRGQNAGGLIRAGRQALGLRQADLGVRLRCSASTISRLESGRLTDLALLRRAAAKWAFPSICWRPP